MIWVKPSWWREIIEFLRIIVQLRMWPLSFVWKYLKGQMIELDDVTWESLKGTDSWRTTNMYEVESVQADRQELDWDPYPISTALQNAFECNSPARVFAPIIIRLPGGDMHLVAGNRRLMLARAYGVRPRCFVL